MKCSVFILGRWASALFVLVLVLSSCSKEPLVAPAGTTDGTAKTIGTTPIGGGSEPTGGSASPKDGIGGDGEDTGISDDGDDISGSERNRKKTS